MKLIIDTSVLIDHLRGGTSLYNILDDIEKENAELIIPTVVLFELFSGKSTQKQLVVDKINKLLKSFQKVELTEKIARRAGELFRDISKNLGAPDYIIAASALELNAVIVTLNKKDFEQIKNLTLYPL